MRVGFLSNQLDNRGTGNALFDYALYNREILGNESVIYTYSWGDHSVPSIHRFAKEFGRIRMDPGPETSDVDVMYHIKSGEDDGIRFPNTRYAVHAVFNATQPHGDRYATISEWMALRDHTPWFVPHIVNLEPAMPLLTSHKDFYGIPREATVIGRYGGADTFDIPWVWESVKRVAKERSDLYFLFANTNLPDVWPMPSNVKFAYEIIGDINRAGFIGACDAMLHARGRGETFGMSVGEFARLGRPIITYMGSPEKAHIHELMKSGVGHFYRDQQGLEKILVDWQPHGSEFAYRNFTAREVMGRFKEVFLD
jgi:hypothetical protein